MLKTIETITRRDFENNMNIKINLKTWVKVKQDWQNNESFFNN